MNRVVALPWLSTLARVVLAGVFLVAGALKVTDPANSVRAVAAYQLLPSGLERVVGWGLPFVEIALGLVLVAGIYTRVAAGVAAVLLIAFIAGVASAAVRGLAIDCGCFGGGGAIAPDATQYTSEILRDAGLLVLAAWLLWRPISRISLDGRQIEEMG